MNKEEEAEVKKEEPKEFLNLDEEIERLKNRSKTKIGKIQIVRKIIGHTVIALCLYISVLAANGLGASIDTVLANIAIFSLFIYSIISIYVSRKDHANKLKKMGCRLTGVLVTALVAFVMYVLSHS